MGAQHKLSDAKLRACPKGTQLFDGAGLHFIKREGGACYWKLRYTCRGRRRDMGLGSYPDTTLSEARELARAARLQAKAGVDPILERERAQIASNTLAEVFDAMFETRKADLKSDASVARWDGPVRLHVLPKLGTIPITELTQHDLKRALAPIWHTKVDTAAKALSRAGMAIEHAAAMGLDVDMQIVAKARALLGKQHHEAKHIPAMPFAEVPAYYSTLGKDTTDLALRFTILTGLRSSAVRNAHTDWIEGDVMTVPAVHMKGTKNKSSDFRVPLPPEALAVVALASDGLLFPAKNGKPISDMTMSRRMERAGLEYRPHGFRSSLRDWCEKHAVRYEVAEACLAHTVGGKVERSYRRTDYLDERAEVMAKWDAHVVGLKHG